jgi:hypothetical protein
MRWWVVRRLLRFFPWRIGNSQWRSGVGTLIAVRVECVSGRLGEPFALGERAVDDEHDFVTILEPLLA